MALPVWTADANHFTVDDNTYHTADGWHIHVSEELPVAGGEDPEHKRRRYRLIAAQREEKMLLMIIKSYMKQIY